MKGLTACSIVVACLYCGAAAACDDPPPVAIPDGRTSTMQEMLAAQAEVMAYQAAMNEYLACLDQEIAAEGERAPGEFKSLMASRYNAAVAEMEGVAAAFNEQIQAFRLANPPPPAN
jgi:hypothetical protein